MKPQVLKLLPVILDVATVLPIRCSPVSLLLALLLLLLLLPLLLMWQR